MLTAILPVYPAMATVQAPMNAHVSLVGQGLTAQRVNKATLLRHSGNSKKYGYEIIITIYGSIQSSQLNSFSMDSVGLG